MFNSSAFTMADFDNPAFDDNDVDDVGAGDDIVVPDNDVIWPDAASFEDATIDGSASGRVSLQQELVQVAVDDYYKAMAEQQEITPSVGRDTTKFTIDDRGKLRLKAYPQVNLLKPSGEPLKLNTIAGRAGGASIIRDELGFADWTRKKPNLPAKAVSALQAANNELGATASVVESVELQDLGQVAKTVSDTVEKMETSLTEADIEAALGTMYDPPLSLREIRGLDKTMQTLRGEHTRNMAKLSELDSNIELEKKKMTEADDDFSRSRVAERLRNLEDERAARLEAAASTREALRSQINRIRETISRILHDDTTLADRVRTLFREQGITIVSILTALGMAISTLVLALTGGSPAGAPTPPPPSDKGGLKDWVKKHLQSLGRILAKLAGKAAAALPGIIGSVVSWLLNLLSKTVGWLAGNIWAIVVAVAGLLLVAVRGHLRTKPKHE